MAAGQTLADVRQLEAPMILMLLDNLNATRQGQPPPPGKQLPGGDMTHGGKPGSLEGPSGNRKQVSHSDDFTSVCWFGKRYQFTMGQQAAAVRALWEAWATGGHSLSELTIGEKVDSGNDHFRLIHVFRNRKGKGYHSVLRQLRWGLAVLPKRREKGLASG